jgi:hypothetical protein
MGKSKRATGLQKNADSVGVPLLRSPAGAVDRGEAIRMPITRIEPWIGVCTCTRADEVNRHPALAPFLPANELNSASKPVAKYCIQFFVAQTQCFVPKWHGYTHHARLKLLQFLHGLESLESRFGVNSHICLKVESDVRCKWRR